MLMSTNSDMLATCMTPSWLRKACHIAAEPAMALVWEKCALSLREIGQMFGGIDYAAIAQRIRRINKANPAGLKKARRKMSNV